ncbi:MAG: TonB-dependent receptor [Flavobacteriales bacterium]
MLLRVFLALLSASFASVLLAQGTVRGKVADKSGETLIGAAVVLKADPSKGTTTDLDGRYSLLIDAPGPHVLVVRYVGYENKEVTVSPKGGEVLVVNIILGESAVALEGVEIEAKAARTNDTYLERMKINNAASMDFISRDAMLKTGDGDATQAVRRITGVSTVGAFVTVRGLADRYIVTTVNGSRLPTLDPLTNNLRLDLFPTGLMDNIVITKTATPDLPGDWAGALISLNTSDYPEKLRVSVGTSIGYNPNSTWKDIVSGRPGKTDWLARDDGGRGIPEGIPDDGGDYPLFVEPNLYEQLSFLGLGGYLSGYGITANTPGYQGTNMSTSNTLQHLPLVELGLLAPALLYNESAIAQAVSDYNGTYNLAYFSPTLNGRLAELNRKWDNTNWRVDTVQGQFNISQNLSLGNQLTLFKKSKNPKALGFLVGLRYNRETEYDPGSTFIRTGEPFNDENPGDEYGRNGTQAISVITHSWNALASLSLKLNRNNSISLLAMANALGQANARYQRFRNPGIGVDEYASEDQYYEQRRMFVYQLSSRHLIPAINTKVEADISYTDGNRDLLDFKALTYVQPPPGEPITEVEAALTAPTRAYRFLNETLLDARLTLEVPLSDETGLVRKLRVGGSYLRNERLNEQDFYIVLGAPGPAQWDLPGRFDMRGDGRFTSLYRPFGTFKDNDIGLNRIIGAFAMVDYALTKRLRAVGGLRGEQTNMITDIRRYYEQGLDPSDPARGTVGDVSAGGDANPDPQPARPGALDQWDFLPSINLIYKLKDDDQAPMNLRLNYFKSLARPSFREFSVVQLFDYILGAPVYGNPKLQMTTADNYDLRIERFFRSRNNVSVSAFHKEFKNHIELVFTASGGYTWRNAIRSSVTGVEVEGRVGILRWIEWRGNVTLMQSQSVLRTTLLAEPVEYTTNMFGQAPYMVNSMLTFSSDSARASLSVSYNVQGPKLAISNSEVNPTGIRAYEMPRHMVDITLNKSFGKHWGLRLGVRNLLNSPFRRAYQFEKGYAVDFDSYAWGTEYSLGLTYTIK